MNIYQPTCISNTCGFCVNCCGNYQQYCSPIQPTYSKNKSLFLSSQIQDHTSSYWKSMNNIHYIKNSYKLMISDYNPIYKLSEDNHFCDTPLCKSIYENTHDHLKTKFSKIPIYKRKDYSTSDTTKLLNCKDHYLCLPCILKQIK